MANKFVLTTGSDAANGSNATPFRTVLGSTGTGGTALCQPGDYLYVPDSNFVEPAATADVILQFATGSLTDPVKVVAYQWSGNNSGGLPVAQPANYAAAKVPVRLATATSGNWTLTFGRGGSYHYGIQYISGNSAINSNLGHNISIGEASQDSCHVFENSELGWDGNTITGGRYIRLGVGTLNDTYIEWRNTDVRFSHNSQSIAVSRSRFKWYGGAVLGVAPLILFTDNAAYDNPVDVIEVVGVDLSILTSSNSLVEGAGGAMVTFKFVNCALDPTVPFFSAAPGSVGGGRVIAQNYGIDTGGKNWRYAIEDANGRLDAVDDTYLTADLTFQDNTTTKRTSWKIVPTTKATEVNPFVTEWYPRYNETVGSVTLTVECLIAGSDGLYDDEIRLEVMGPTVSTANKANLTPITHTGRSHVASRAACTSSVAGNWTKGGGTWTAFKLTKTITTTEQGEIFWRVCVGRATATRGVLTAGSGYTVYVANAVLS